MESLNRHEPASIARNGLKMPTGFRRIEANSHNPFPIRIFLMALIGQDPIQFPLEANNLLAKNEVYVYINGYSIIE